MNALRSWILAQMQEERMRVLMAMSDDELKSLWDRWDGGGLVDGHDGDDIHAALNRKGLGRYCAV